MISLFTTSYTTAMPAGGVTAQRARLEGLLNNLFRYLVDIYRAVGNDEVNWTDAWWRHIDMMLSTRRLISMNHTHLWREESEDDEEETIGDDLFTPSANARSLYQDSTNGRWNEKVNGNGSSSRRCCCW